MYLCQKNQIKGLSRKQFDVLWYLTRLAKNVYNETNYTLKNWHDINDEFLSYADLCYIAKNSLNYQRMPSQVGQQVIKVLVKSWTSFFHVLNERKKGNYNRPVNTPNYLKKEGHFVLVFQTQSFKIIDDGKVARLSMGKWFTNERGIRYLFFNIPPHVQDKTIKEIRILPRWNARYFEIEYVYEKELEKHDLDESKYLGIDLGLDNLATCVDTDANAFIMDGKVIKSFNQWWNKKKARLQSVHDKQGIKGSRAMARLSMKRDDKIRNFMGQTVNHVIKHCLENNIGNIVIGKLDGIKQNATLGKRNNQNFQSIPFGFFKQKLKSKCEVHGITYQEVNEAYTSQTCSICGKRKKSNRIHRGAYLCRECKQLINADVNGAVNILKKVVPESVTIGNSGVVNTPCRIRLVV